MTDDEMDDHRSRRGAGAALVLGSVGSLGAGALGALLTVWAMRQWPGWQVAHVADGLGFLSTLAAAMASGWVAVLLARAVLCLLTDGGGPEGESVRPAPATGSSTQDLPRARSRGGRGPSPAVRHVATGLLTVGALLASPVVAGATEAVVTSRVTSHASGSHGAWSSTVGPSATPGTEVEGSPDGVDQGVPRPGWTPPVLPAPQRPSADVGLVSATTHGEEPVDHVVVHRGDTLWDITARHLGQQATDQDVAEQWPLWYAANRDVIGDDPHLLRPGQQLVAPAPEAHP